MEVVQETLEMRVVQATPEGLEIPAIAVIAAQAEGLVPEAPEAAVAAMSAWGPFFTVALLSMERLETQLVIRATPEVQEMQAPVDQAVVAALAALAGNSALEQTLPAT